MINPDGTLKGYEFSKGYDPDAPPVYVEGDLIDFPCSPAFVRHFANLGLTKDFPPEYYRTNLIKNVLRGGEGGIREQKEKHFAGRAEVLHLQRKLNDHLNAKPEAIEWQEK